MVIALNNVRSSMGACIIIYTKTFCGVRSAVLTVTFMNYCIKYKVKLMGVVPFPDPPSDLVGGVREITYIAVLLFVRLAITNEFLCSTK